MEVRCSWLVTFALALLGPLGCGRGADAPVLSAREPGHAAEPSEPAEPALPPLYGNMISTSSASLTVSYTTDYMPPLAELAPAEGEPVSRAIDERIESIRSCVEPLVTQDSVAWSGTVRIHSPPGGQQRVEVAGRGASGTERCVRAAAHGWQLLPAELASGPSVEIPLEVSVPR